MDQPVYMKASSQQHNFRFHNLGIGDIQLGRKPEQIPALVPFQRYSRKNSFIVSPNPSLYQFFNGDVKVMIENDDPGLALQHLFTSINEYGFINRIFLYTRKTNERLAGRLSQLYGEPKMRKAGQGTQNVWVTESETEITLFSPLFDPDINQVISFRFFHDLPALKEYIIEGRT